MSTAIQFGRLEDVLARTAWDHEAHSFTPWLADNLGLLSEAIGIPLELTAREQSVGRFSADIVAHDSRSDSVVLIENQLERSDHTHLGQIMTYLAGTEAKVIIWIAPAFCEEHLSAISWLNQHSHEEFSFFAVRLRVERIGESPFAPLFEILEQPNEWERSLNQKVRSQSLSESTLIRRAFWDKAIEADPSIADDRATGPGGSNRWRAVPGTHLIVNRYKSKDEIGIYFRTIADMSDEEFFDFMEPYVSQFERELNVEPGQYNSFWIAGPEISDDNPETWHDAIKWLGEKTQKYVAAVQKIIPQDAD
jgi:hypothetical protein